MNLKEEVQQILCDIISKRKCFISVWPHQKKEDRIILTTNGATVGYLVSASIIRSEDITLQDVEEYRKYCLELVFKLIREGKIYTKGMSLNEIEMQCALGTFTCDLDIEISMK